MRPRLLALLPLLWLAAAAPEPLAAGPEDAAPGCRHWAVLLPEDAGQLRVYDGIRKGLELAQLERLCLKDLADEAPAFQGFVAEHAALPEPRPLVFLIGRRAGDRMIAAAFQGPGVYVSTEWTAGGVPLVAETALPPGVTRVRAELPAETLGQVLRELLGDPSPSWHVFWSTPFGPDEPPEGLGRALRLEPGLLTNKPHFFGGGLWLSLGLWVGRHAPMRFSPAHVMDLGAGVVVSDDVAHYGGGAAMVVVPDHERLGRTAAEAGRRLWRGEAAGGPLVVRSAQVLVDLDACASQGIKPSLTFLAGVDGLKGRRAAHAAAGSGR